MTERVEPEAARRNSLRPRAGAAGGRVLQVNVAPQGGVPKRPVPEAMVRRLGLDGDKQADTRHHGGPRQAVLVIDLAGIEALKAQGFPVFPGALGENLTTEGLDLRPLGPGTRLRAGEAILEVTKPRQPCRTIHAWGGPAIGKACYDARVDDGEVGSPRWGLSGLYCAVVREGMVRAGDAVLVGP